MAIQGFKSKTLERFAEKRDARRLPAQHLRRIGRILEILDDPNALKVLRETKNWRLHQLSGNRKGVWSVRVSARWRITFRYDGQNAYEVDLTQHFGD